MMNLARLAKAIAVSATLVGSVASADTLSDVKARGGLRCGVHIEKPGFATADASGRINGFDADFCRGIAAALGVEARFTALAPAQRFTALTSGAVDVLLMTTTQTMQRDTTLGVEFPFINFYGGGMLITRKSLNVTSARQLDGATICLNQGTTADQFIADFFRLNKITYKQVMFERLEDGLRGYVEGRCDVFTQDDTTLAAMKAAMKDPKEHLILPEVLSKEPVGAVTRNNDPRFSGIVRWVFAALVNAEEKGVTQANVDEASANSPDPDVQRMLGKTGKLGADIGLSPNWAALAIKSVGNYGEIFDRHLGQQSRFKMERGVNNLWSRGGLIYGLPIR